jgi:hypothetical protein
MTASMRENEFKLADRRKNETFEMEILEIIFMIFACESKQIF